MIDADGYRPNVGIIICNRQGQVMWAKRYGQNSWQFPQGGINDGETPEQAMFRELYEEVGLQKKDVRVLYVSKQWLRYKLPKRLLRYDSKPICIGQKQRWFLLQLTADESAINMNCNKTPEFDGWRWVSFWYPVRQVVSFKRDVYRRAMKEFATFLFEYHKTDERIFDLVKTSSTHISSDKPQMAENLEKSAVRNTQENQSVPALVQPLEKTLEKSAETPKKAMFYKTRKKSKKMRKGRR